MYYLHSNLRMKHASGSLASQQTIIGGSVNLVDGVPGKAGDIMSLGERKRVEVHSFSRAS